MKNLFSLDNPFIQFLARVGDLILANVLFLICSLPVFTIGASLTALHKVSQDIVAEQEKAIFKTFFQAFRENFKQATILWLMMLLFFVGMGCNLLLIVTYTTGNLALILKWLLGFIVVIVLAVTAYLFPLMVRYENTLKEHFVNAGILAVVKLPRTVLMVAVNLLPLLIMYFSMQTFFSTLIFWLIIGFAFISYIDSSLLMPVFREMEQSEGPGVQIMT